MSLLIPIIFVLALVTHSQNQDLNIFKVVQHHNLGPFCLSKTKFVNVVGIYIFYKLALFDLPNINGVNSAKFAHFPGTSFSVTLLAYYYLLYCHSLQEKSIANLQQ